MERSSGLGGFLHNFRLVRNHPNLFTYQDLIVSLESKIPFSPTRLCDAVGFNYSVSQMMFQTQEAESDCWK